LRLSAAVDLAPEVDVDVVPAGELLLHLPVDARVGVLDPPEGLVGEHHAEPEGVVGGVPLPDGDLVLRLEMLGERREVETAWPAADHSDAHREFLPDLPDGNEVTHNVLVTLGDMSLRVLLRSSVR